MKILSFLNRWMRCLLLLILFSSTVSAATDVQIAGTWVQGETHAVEAGSNRALLFFAHTEYYGSNQKVNSVTYGGQTMTKVLEKTKVNGSYEIYVAAFILNEAGIAAATNGNFSVSWNHTPAFNREPDYSSVFVQNVDQTTSIGETASATGTTNDVSTASLNTLDGDMAFVAGTQGITGSYSTINSFIEGLEVAPESGDGVAGYLSATGSAVTPGVSHSWGSGYHQAVVGFVVKSNDPGAGGPPTDQQLIDAMEDAVTYYRTVHGTAGLNVALVRNGQTIWEEGRGYSNLANQTLYTPSTTMRSGSIGKSITALAIMQLVEDGQFNTSTQVNTLMANVQMNNPRTYWFQTIPITVHHLLTHTSGLVTNVAVPDVQEPTSNLENHLLFQLGLSYFQPYDYSYLGPIWWQYPGKGFLYSNTGMAALGQIVAENNTANDDFQDYVQNNIFDPMGMTSSVYPDIQNSANVPAAIWNNQSTGYARYGQIYIPTTVTHFGDYPAGNIMSTPGDMVKILAALLNNGTSPHNSHQLLQSSTVNDMLTPKVTTTFSTYGYGWYIKDEGTPDHRFGHSGAHMYGHNNVYRAFPQQDIAVAVASNSYNMVPDREPVGQLIAAYAKDFLKGTPPDISAPLDTYSWVQPGVGSTNPNDYEWKVSYAAGLMLAERTKGSIGVTSTITQAMIDAMAAGVVERLNVTQSATTLWSADGFKDGFNDMLTNANPMTQANVDTYVTSNNMQITPAELESIYYNEFGGDDYANNAFGKIH